MAGGGVHSAELSKAVSSRAWGLSAPGASLPVEICVLRVQPQAESHNKALASMPRDFTERPGFWRLRANLLLADSTAVGVTRMETLTLHLAQVLSTYFAFFH